MKTLLVGLVCAFLGLIGTGLDAPLSTGAEIENPVVLEIAFVLGGWSEGCGGGGGRRGQQIV
jgi:hypothetical protein